MENLKNLVECYQTEHTLVELEIEKYRKLGLPLSCVSTINPWAYDLKKFDLQLIMNNDLADLIESSLSSLAAQVFWTSYFKC